MQTELIKFINDPFDAEKVFWLAEKYYNKGHTASALTYYLRVTEYSKDDNLIYEALVKAGLCLQKQNNRVHSTEGVYLQAISYLPKRPEAYFLLSRLYEENKKWNESYMLASVALSTCDFDSEPLKTSVEYFSKDVFIFEKAVCAWWMGRLDESLELFLELRDKALPSHYTVSIENNLKLFNLPETKEKIDIVLQGPYTETTNEIISTYLQLPFVNNIIISYWENDNPRKYNSNRVKFIENKYPTTSGTGNKNYQIVSSFAGVKLITTRYAAKMRTDQKYTIDSMYKMYQFFFDNKKDDHQLFVGGMFPSLLFHPKDHIFWGKASDLITLFDIPLELNSFADKVKIGKDKLYLYYNYFVRAETYIGAHYCANFEDYINKYLLQPEKYLYDNAPKWNEVYNISDVTTSNYFKAFPQDGIDFSWPKKDWDTYPYENQKKYHGERWHEDGC
jgi:tetratricopeptide (TPR) repeat protein